MSASNLTIGDVLPTSMRSNYSQTVLDVSVEEALQIAVYDMPPTSDLSAADVASINEIYATYMSSNSHNSDSAYWNKSAEDNKAFWNK